MSSGQCKHSTIIEDRRDANGSVWGRCTCCGDNTFPLVDVAYQRFKEGEDLVRSVRMETEAMLKVAEALAPHGPDARDRILRALLVIYEPVLAAKPKS